MPCSSIIIIVENSDPRVTPPTPASCHAYRLLGGIDVVVGCAIRRRAGELVEDVHRPLIACSGSQTPPAATLADTRVLRAGRNRRIDSLDPGEDVLHFD